jgi:allophanate hydrolase subunit 2
MAAAGFGGFHGRAIRRRDVLPVGIPAGGTLAPSALPGPPARLAVLPGPHLDRFTSDAWERLLAGAWTVSSTSNRVGVRLEGAALAGAAPAGSPPTPMVPGALQVTPDGTPIVLGPDHPVTGGYAVLAVLPAASRRALAGLGPGATFHFTSAP